MKMWPTPFLKCNTYSICFVFPNGRSGRIPLKNTSTLYRKCLTTSLYFTNYTVISGLKFLGPRCKAPGCLIC